MKLNPLARKNLLIAHLISTVGWLGALCVFLAFSVSGIVSGDLQHVRGAYLAMESSAWNVILPLSCASLVTGLVQAWGTAWGLIRHFWVLTKFAITLLSFIVFVTKLQPISDLAQAASMRVLLPGDFSELRFSLALHAAGGLALLLATTALSVFKPWGQTAYGRNLRLKTPEVSHVIPKETLVVQVQPGVARKMNWALIIGIHAVGMVLLSLVIHFTSGGMRH